MLQIQRAGLGIGFEGQDGMQGYGGVLYVFISLE
jgi:hypothetical protein